MDALFGKAWHDSKRTLFSLALGLGLYGMLTLAFFPTLVAEKAELQKLMENLPRQMISAMYSGDVEDFDFTDPAIYFQARFAIWMILVAGGILTGQALGAILGAERQNKLDLILSLPVTRREYLTSRYLYSAATIVCLLVVILVVFGVGSIVITEFDVPLDRLALGVGSAFFILMAQVSIAYALAAFAPSSSNWATPLVYGYFFGTYILTAFEGTIDLIDHISPLFLFSYYDAGIIIHDGLDIGNLLVLTGVIGVSAAIAFWGFERKQLGT
jgi:ABC-2 type transport system permease protein